MIWTYLKEFEFFLQNGQINEFVLRPHAMHWVVFPTWPVLSGLRINFIIINTIIAAIPTAMITPSTILFVCFIAIQSLPILQNKEQNTLNFFYAVDDFLKMVSSSRLFL